MRWRQYTPTRLQVPHFLLQSPIPLLTSQLALLKLPLDEIEQSLALGQRRSRVRLVQIPSEEAGEDTERTVQ